MLREEDFPRHVSAMYFCDCLFHVLTIYPVRRFRETCPVYFPVTVHTELDKVLFRVTATEAWYYVVDLYCPVAVTDGAAVVVTSVHVFAVFADFCGQQLLRNMRCAPLGSWTEIPSMTGHVVPGMGGLRAYPQIGWKNFFDLIMAFLGLSVVYFLNRVEIRVVGRQVEWYGTRRAKQFLHAFGWCALRLSMARHCRISSGRAAGSPANTTDNSA